MLARLRSPGVGQGVFWVSALVLLAGVIAYATVHWGSADSKPVAGVPEDFTEFDPGPTTTPPAVSEVPKAARAAAGQFILAAAGREDLPKAWKLSHPDLKRQCECTYKQWLTGNIPVQPFPTAGLRGVSYFVDELAPKRVVLQVLLKPAPGSDLADQAFHIGLKAVSNGKGTAWLVDLWSPISGIPIPQGSG